MRTTSIFSQRFFVLIVSLLGLCLCFVNCRKNMDADEQRIQGLRAVSLQCEILAPLQSQTRAAIYAHLNESKVKLAEVSVCDSIPREQYASLGIPADALSAAGGQKAGVGEYVYAQLTGGELQFFIGGIGASAGERPSYTPLAIYRKNKFQLLRPLHLADLAGYYMHQAPDTSYILFLGLKGPSLVGKLFATGEPMPAQKVLQRALPAFAATEELPFNCDLNGLHFESNLGTGQFYWEQDSAAINFHSFMGVDKDVAFELMTY